MDTYPEVSQLLFEIKRMMSESEENDSLLITLGGPPYSGKTSLVRKLKDEVSEQYAAVYLHHSGKIAEYGVFDSSFFTRPSLIKEIAKSAIPGLNNVVSLIYRIENSSLLIGEQQSKVYDELSYRRGDKDLLIICDDYDSWDDCSKRVIVSYLEHKNNSIVNANNFRLVIIRVSDKPSERIPRVRSKQLKLSAYCAQCESDYRSYIHASNISSTTITQLFNLSSGNVGLSKYLLRIISTFTSMDLQETLDFPLPDRDKLNNHTELARWYIRSVCSRNPNMERSLGILSSFNGSVRENLLFELANTFFRLMETKDNLSLNLEENIFKAIEFSIIKYHNKYISFCDALCKDASYAEAISAYKEVIRRWHSHIAACLIKNTYYDLYEIYWHLQQARNLKLANEYYCLYCIEMKQKGDNDLHRLNKLRQTPNLYAIYKAIINYEPSELSCIDTDEVCARLRIEINYALVLGYYRKSPRENSREIIEICENYINETTIHFKLRFRFAWLLLFHYMNRLDDVDAGRSVYKRICIICDGSQLNETDESEIKAKLVRVSSAFLSQEMACIKIRNLLTPERRENTGIKDTVMLLTNLAGCEIACGKYEEAFAHSRDAMGYLKNYPWYGSFKVINNFFVSWFLYAKPESKKDILNQFIQYSERGLIVDSFWINMNKTCMKEIISPSLFSDSIFPLQVEEYHVDYNVLLVYYNRVTHAILNANWEKAEDALNLAKGIVPSICIRDQADVKARWDIFHQIVREKKSFSTYEELRMFVVHHMKKICLWSEPYIISDLQYWSEL